MTAAQRDGTSVPDPTSHGMGPTAAVGCAVAEVQGQGPSTLYSKSGQASPTTSRASRVHGSHAVVARVTQLHKGLGMEDGKAL